MLFTTMTMLCGFSVLLFSDMVGVVKFGGLGCLDVYKRQWRGSSAS